MNNNRRNLIVVLVLIAATVLSVLPSDADRLRRHRLFRRFPDFGWCPYEGVPFRAGESAVTIKLTVKNVAADWYSKRIDNVFVVTEDVYNANLQNLASPSLGDDESQCVYSETFFVPPVGEMLVLAESFPAGDPKWNAGWAGLTEAADIAGTGAATPTFWAPASTAPDPATGSFDGGGSLGLGPQAGGDATVSLTVSGLVPGQRYVFSSWWYLGGEVLSDQTVTIDISETRFARAIGALDSEQQVNQSPNQAHSSNDLTFPSVAGRADGEFVVAWDSRGYYRYPEGVLGAGGYARRYNSSGLGLGFELSLGTTRKPSVGMDAQGRFIVVWEDPQGDIKGRRYDSNGSSLGQEFQINDFTSDTLAESAVAMNAAGRFVTVWESQGTAFYNKKIRGQLFDESGGEVGAEFQVPAYIPSSPAVAMGTDGNFIVVWSTGEVHARRFDSLGFAIGDEFQVNAYATGAQEDPVIALGPDGDFFVVWQSDGSDGSDSDSRSIQGRLFASDGSMLATELQINTVTAGSQESPAVGVEPGGEFLVVWNSEDNIQARHLHADGTPVDDELRVNFLDQDAELNPSVAGTLPGEFVVSWTSSSVGTEYGGYQSPGGEIEETTTRIQRLGVPGLTPPLFSDAELGADGFVFNNDTGESNGLWHVTSACNASLIGHSASSAFYFGLDGTCNYDLGLTAEGHLLSPEIDLTRSSLLLKFNYYLHTEGAASFGFDVVEVSLSADGGVFQTLAHNDPARAGFRLADPSSNWRSASIDLSPWIGSKIRLRWSFFTGDSLANEFPGFYVDDIRIFQLGGTCPGAAGDGDDDGDSIPNSCDICSLGDDTVDVDGDGTPDPCEPFFRDGFESGNTSSWS